MKYDLKKHIAKRHLKKSKPMKEVKDLKLCHLRTSDDTLCEAPFENRQQLEHHINTVHFKIKPYKCSDCELSFASQSVFNNHFDASHVKRFVCMECKKSFSSNSWLKLHLKVHLKKKDEKK